ncbi:MAG: histidine phosphatase family protein [Acidimicrobiales bacterium]
MDVYLIRHAHAGSRSGGSQDKYRQLSDKGKARAEAIAELFASIDVCRIVSSTATRCVQTVEPLAASKGLAVKETDVLWEGGPIDQVLALLERHVDKGLVACSHGDIIPELIDWLGDNGTNLSGHGCEKGSIWVLTHDGKRWTNGRKVGKHAESI